MGKETNHQIELGSGKSVYSISDDRRPERDFQGETDFRGTGNDPLKDQHN